MKTQIENPVQFCNLNQFKEAKVELIDIIQDILTSNDFEEVIINLDYNRPFNHFIYGKESNHIWITQLNSKGEIYDRTILVTK